MPIPSPGTYDQASQATLLTVKAKTDLITGAPALEANRTVGVHGVVNTMGSVTLVPPADEVWDLECQINYANAANAATLTKLYAEATAASIALLSGSNINARVAPVRISNENYLTFSTAVGGVNGTFHYDGMKYKR